MALWLFKQEPDSYPYSQLEHDGQTFWDGVANPLAKKYLRACAPGDRVFFYHTGDEKAVVGVMEVTGPPVTDSEDPSEVAVPVKPVHRLANPVTLATIKANPVFATWELVKQPRLSVMPVSPEFWSLIESLAGGASTPSGKPTVKPAPKKPTKPKK